MEILVGKHKATQIINFLEENCKLLYLEPDFVRHLFSGYTKAPDKQDVKEMCDVRGITKVPVFCTKQCLVDFPDIIEVLNTYELNAKPTLYFYLEKSDSTWPQNSLAIVLAMCSTNRLEDVDCKLLEELRTKGFKNVLMVALRKGSDPTKISTISNRSVESGVGQHKTTLQFVFYKGHVLMDSSTNISNILLFFELAKSAFQQ